MDCWRARSSAKAAREAASMKAIAELRGGLTDLLPVLRPIVPYPPHARRLWPRLLHGVLHSKARLAHFTPAPWRPGATAAILRRTRQFVSPILCFLFSVFLIFAVLTWSRPPFAEFRFTDARRRPRWHAISSEAQALARQKAELEQRGARCRTRQSTAAWMRDHRSDRRPQGVAVAAARPPGWRDRRRGRQ